MSANDVDVTKRDPSTNVATVEDELVRVRAERDRLAAALQNAPIFRAAAEVAPIGIMCVSGEKGRYVFINEAFARMIGYPLAEVMEADPYEIWVAVTHPDDLPMEREAMERVAKGEIDRFQIEKRIVPRVGDPIWVRVDAHTTRAPSGRIDCITVFFRDVHAERLALAERERLENALRQAQKLDAIGKLAGGVAHDFNNRLLIILGYTEMLKRELPANSPLSGYADMVLNSAQRGAELTRQLLAYSRRQVLKPESFDVNQTVDRMRRLLERLIGESIELTTKGGARNPVFSDPGQFEQVVLNLAINARDAMPNGGRLTLETSDLTLDEGDDPILNQGDYILLTVTDTGTGIPDDILPHVFEPFFTTKEVGQGTGLGLSMVQGIVQQSGGTVRVDTTVGEGTQFRVYLPSARNISAPAPYTSVPALSRPPSEQTVLICDDDDDVRRLLVDVMGLRAYTVLQARNGRQALDLAAQHRGPINLLVTDVVMPQVGGIELATELRKRHPALRVLFVSGYTEQADLLSEPMGPDTQFLAKPFLPGDLTRTVFSLLEVRPSG